MLKRERRPTAAEQARKPRTYVVRDDHQHTGRLKRRKHVPQRGSRLQHVIQDVNHHGGRNRAGGHVRRRRHCGKYRDVPSGKPSLQLSMNRSVRLREPKGIELPGAGAAFRKQADVCSDF
jgi:hypothetical protein